ncbi:MAG: methyltransferase domain-containing protein [Alphaproteobacteria bacterium]|nr:methyltransferase domain-containing protein [Alphaproteobacteria bacterium]
MQRSTRVNYDAIAERYDSTPHREKSADPELIAFLAGRGPTTTLRLLDIACGTGNQQIANRDLAPNAQFVGLDGSLGVLRQARRKTLDIAWVHGDSAALPFAAGSFDFVGCQYAFHHFRDKAGMLREAFRVLRRGGRFALYNMCPQEADDWLYYDYFPEAKSRDFADFWPPDAIVSEMSATGFSKIELVRRHVHHERELAELLSAMRFRERNSQLLSLSDAAYAAGLRRIERDLDDPQAPKRRAEHLCFVTARGDRR